MPHLAHNRRVIAPDYPGYGGSDGVPGPPSISHYADAISAVITDQTQASLVDLLGFHTGCLVAIEVALQCPERVRRVVMLDVPYFDAAERATAYGANLGLYSLTSELCCLTPAWERGITRRVESQGIERSFEMFVEQLRAARTMNAAFEAAHKYDCLARLPCVQKPVTVIASQSPLLAASRRAAAELPMSTLIERLDIKRAVLDEAPERIARDIMNALAVGEQT